MAIDNAIHPGRPGDEAASPPAFADPEGLRALLLRIRDAGPGSWREDSDVPALMQFAMDRYAMLALKHDRTPQDAATFAWEAMLNECTLTADNPWAVITTAVQRALYAEERAEGLLCSPSRVTQSGFSDFHDATRFSEYEDEDPALFHPALQIIDDFDGREPDWELEGTGLGLRYGTTDRDTGTAHAVRDAVHDIEQLMIALGWDAEVTRSSLVYICQRLMDQENRTKAYELLRRDVAACINLDLSRRAWTGLLRVVLGNPSSPSLSARHGLLARLLIGDTLEDLLDDDRVVRAVTALADPRWSASAADLASAIIPLDHAWRAR